MSLSRFLRDYLYIPLGGNRDGRVKTYRNLMTTMLLGGLWHGAGIAYVLWGLYHGSLLACQRLWHDFVAPRLRSIRTPGTHCDLTVAQLHGEPVLQRPVGALTVAGSLEEPESTSWSASGQTLTPGALVNQSTAGAVQDPRIAHEVVPQPNRLSLLARLILIVIFFHITCLGWLLFRAGSLPAGVDQFHFVLSFLRTMIVLPTRIDPIGQGILVLGAASLFFQWKYDSMNHFSRWRTGAQVLAVIIALTAILSLGVFEGSQFIYFQF